MGVFSFQNLERMAWLGGGAVWLTLGGGPEACVAMGAAASGIAGVKANAIRKDLLKTSPDTLKAIERVQKGYKEQLDRRRFGRSDEDDEALEEIDDVLAELIFDNWPAPRRLAELATDPDGFPEAVARDVVDRIAVRAETYGHLKPVEQGGNADARAFAIDVIAAVMNAAAAEENYFKTIAPSLVFEGLECLGDIKRTTARIEAGQETLREVLEGKLDAVKADTGESIEILRRLEAQLAAKGQTLDPLSEQTMIDTIKRLREAGDGARKRAGEKLVEYPPDPDGAPACVFWRQSLELFQEIGMPHRVSLVTGWMRDAGCTNIPDAD